MPDICAGYHGGNEFSTEAHESVAFDKKRQSRLILDFLRDRNAICEEVEHALGMKHQTASARISELKKAGLIVPVGRGNTTSGRTAAIYQVTA